MLAGRYPSDEFAEPQGAPDLGSRRRHGRRRAATPASSPSPAAARSPNAACTACSSGEGGPRVGELDEEMVYESRPGETFVLGASTWRIERITPQQVIVSPAPGEPGKTPFWHGDARRPAGRARPRAGRVQPPRGRHGRASAGARRAARPSTSLDELAARNLLAYLAEQKAATGAVPERPDHRRRALPRRAGRLAGLRADAVRRRACTRRGRWPSAPRVRERLGIDLYAIWTDDGIALRLPEGLEDGPIDDAAVPGRRRASRTWSCASWAARRCSPRASARTRRGRCCCRAAAATRARRCGRCASARPTCWPWPVATARSRSCSRRTASACRTCSTCPRCRRSCAASSSARSASTSVETPPRLAVRALAAVRLHRRVHVRGRRAAGRTARPGAGARPRAAARAARPGGAARAARPDRAGRAGARAAVARPSARARTKDQVHDLLRRLGDLTRAEVAARSAERPTPPEWLTELAAERRAVQVRIAGDERWIAVEDVARYRDALGVQPPRGVPDVFLEPTVDALDSAAAALGAHACAVHRARPGRALGPAARRWCRTRCAASKKRGTCCAASSARAGPNASGAIRTSCARCAGARWRACGARSSRSGAARSARFLPAWQGVGSESGSARSPARGRRPARRGVPARGRSASATCCRRGCAATSRACSTSCAPAAKWSGSARGSLGADDGRVALFRRDRLACWRRSRPKTRPTEPIHQRIRDHLAGRGASFFREIFSAVGGPTDSAVLDALWDLVWAGEITNDTLTPLRLRLLRKARSAPPGAPGADRAARGGRALVAGAVHAVDAPTAAHALAVARCSNGTAWSPASRCWAKACRAGSPRSTRCCAPWRKRARFGAATSSRAWAPRSSRCLAPSTACAPSAYPSRRRSSRCWPAADPANPYGATLPWPKSGRSCQRVARRVRGAGRRRAGAVRRAQSAKAWSCCPPSSTTRRDALGALRSLAENAPRRELAIERIDGETVAQLAAAAAARAGRLRARVPGPDPALRRPLGSPAGEECLKATRSSRRPPRCGRCWSGARSWPPVLGSPGRRSSASSAARVTSIEPLGKHLVIRFNNGLALHSHLRMAGAWHRYAPGERWKMPAWQARVVLEVPEHVVVCFHAPVMELMEDRAVALHPGLSRSARTCSATTFDADEAVPAPAARPDARHRRSAARPAQPGRHRQRVQERNPVHRVGQPLDTRRQLSTTPLHRLIATARHLLRKRTPRRPAASPPAAPPASRQPLGLRPRRPTLPPLPHPHPIPPPGPPESHHLLVPHCQPTPPTTPSGRGRG